MKRKNVMDYVLQEKKETVASKLEAEKQKLGELELRLRDLLATTASRRSSEDSGTITWSDEDSGKTADTVVRIIINIIIIMIIITIRTRWCAEIEEAREAARARRTCPRIARIAGSHIP